MRDQGQRPHRADAFYARVLGAAVIRIGEAYRVYRFGDTQLSVHGPEMNIDPAKLARLPVAAGNSDLCFEWPGPVEEALAHLQACDVPVMSGPLASLGVKGHGTSVYFRDPDGSLLEFITYVPVRDPSILTDTAAKYLKI